MAEPGVAGLLLAAGAGRRFGKPKALVRVHGQTLVERAVHVLTAGGCASLTVVLGAAAEEVRAELPGWVHTVTATDWADGMGASLRAGLRALPTELTAVLVHLVDLPGVDERTVAAVGAHAEREVVARAAYHGRPGHPVLIGAAHLAELTDTLAGDQGARAWLRQRSVRLVECGAFGYGDDLDTPADGVRLGLWSDT